MPLEAVIEEKDKDFSIYEVPLSLVENKLDQFIVDTLGLSAGKLELDPRFQTDYKLLWANELHPTEAGYDVLAKVVAKKLKDELHIG